MTANKLEVMHEVLQHVDAPQWVLFQEGLRWHECRLGRIVPHVAAIQPARPRFDIILGRQNQRRTEVELMLRECRHVATFLAVQASPPLLRANTKPSAAKNMNAA
jgi:hypothetical protein